MGNARTVVVTVVSAVTAFAGCGTGPDSGSDEAASLQQAVAVAKVPLCHLPPGNPANVQYISVGASAVAAHRSHGDGTCAAGSSDCCVTRGPASVCTNFHSDSANCGACGHACFAGQLCSAGACVCPGTTTACSGHCVDTFSDVANCGACGTSCLSGQSCSAGACVYSSTCDPSGRWTELTLQGGPSGPVLNSGPLVNFDAGSGRLIVFYASNPSVSYRSGETSQVWLLDNANGLGASPAWTQLTVSGDLPNNINANTTVVYTPQNQLILYGGCEFNCSPAQSDVYQLSNANGIGGPAVWSHVNIAAPRARAGHQSAFDPTTSNMISFGGNFAFYGTDQNDTAIFDTSTSSWSTLSIAGAIPGARSEAFSSAYDAAARRFMIFGGSHLISTCCPYNESQYNDLWVLENANGIGTPAWQQLSPAGSPPSPRGGNSAAFDPVHQRLLVYGGSNWSNAAQSSTALGDLWQVTHANGVSGQPTWSQLCPTGDIPGPISNPGAAFDSQNQRMMLVGMGDVTTNTPPRVWVLTP